MQEDTDFLTAKEMQVFGGPYRECSLYFTPWAHDEIVKYVANFNTRFSGGITVLAALKMQQELPSAVVFMEGGLFRFFFPLTQATFYVTEVGELKK